MKEKQAQRQHYQKLNLHCGLSINSTIKTKTKRKINMPNSLFTDGLSHSGVERGRISIVGQLAVAAVHCVSHKIVFPSLGAADGVVAG